MIGPEEREPDTEFAPNSVTGERLDSGLSNADLDSLADHAAARYQDAWFGRGL